MSESQSQFSDQPTARLIMQKGPHPNQTFDLVQQQITIGRSSINGISITDPEISRKHAQLVKQDMEYAIEDLGSTNGTFVNNRRIVGLTPLHDGDIIEFGEAISLLYEAESTLPIDIPTPPTAQPEPTRKPVQAEPAYQPPAAQQVSPAPTFTPAATPTDKTSSSSSCRRNALLGCGTFLILIFLCTATLFFLDAYQQGRLLYCGPLQSLWELILGPFGFAPLCS